MKVLFFGGGSAASVMVEGEDGTVVLSAGGQASHERYLNGFFQRSKAAPPAIDALHIPDPGEAGGRALVEATLAWRVFDLHAAEDERASPPSSPRPPAIRNVWVNDPTDYLGEFDRELRRGLESWILPLAMDRSRPRLVPQLVQFFHDVEGITRLRRNLSFLDIPINLQSKGELMVCPESQFQQGSLRVSVLVPQLDDLLEAGVRWRAKSRSGREIFAQSVQRASLLWAESDLSETDRLRHAMLEIASALGRAGVATPPATLPLSLLVTEGDKRLMLPGAAGPGQVLAGLSALDLLGESPTLQMSAIHMNSELALDSDFHQRVCAKHYLFSCDGASPSLEAVEATFDARVEAPGRFVFNFNAPGSSEDEETVEQAAALSRWSAKVGKKARGVFRARFLRRGPRLEVRL